MTTEDNGFDKEKVLSRVKKMMALANDAAATEGERDNAMRMAHATLAKWNLTMAEADAAGGTQEKRGPGTLEQRSRPWIRQCSYAIAQLFFCEYFYERSGNNKMRSYFIGKESNVLTAVGITQHVIASIQREGKARMRAKGRTLAWYVSFTKGATDSVQHRCAQLRAEAERADRPAGAPGTALVLANVYALESDANKRYLAEIMHIKLHASASRERAAGDGYHEGREHGNRVGLHRQVGTGVGEHKQLN